MSNIEKIRQEIERRKNICEGIFERESDTYYQGKAVAYGELLAFIDSLPDESKVDVTDFCKPIDPGIAQCIADNWWEMLGEEETPSEDLKDAAARYERENRQSILSSVDIVDAFIAGAEWQARQLLKGSPLPEDTVLFQKGVEEGKRLMMEEAVEGDIVKTINDKLALHSRYVNLDKFHFGDKVKIIIVKEDDRPRD